MPRRRPRAGDREESTVAENPSKLAFKVHPLRVARKLEREEQRRPSGGADPGPSGFAWKELERTKHPS
jgi:hypothetical protein